MSSLKKVVRGATASSIVIAIASIGSLQTADARPSTKSFTCEGLRNFIASRGAVVMNTKNSNVYRDLFLADSIAVLVKLPFPITLRLRTARVD